MTLGEIIMKYRAEHNLSQRQFAAQCQNVTNGYISMVEQGRNPAPIQPPRIKYTVAGTFSPHRQRGGNFMSFYSYKNNLIAID